MVGSGHPTEYTDLPAMTFRPLAVLGLVLFGAAPAFAGDGLPTWTQLETLRQDRVQLAAAYHLRTRDSRSLTHELAVGNRPAAVDLGRQLDGDDALIARARARLRHDEHTDLGG